MMIRWLKRLFCPHFWVSERYAGAFMLKDERAFPPYERLVGTQWWLCLHCRKWTLKPVDWLPINRVF